MLRLYPYATNRCTSQDMEEIKQLRSGHPNFKVNIVEEPLRLTGSLGMRMGLGPTIRKLESYPPVLDLVFGAYGEASDGVKKLLDKMVESRVASLGLRKGTQEAGKEMSLVTGYLRRRLSSAVMRANVKCLLERLVLVGEGQGQAGRRREWARREEEQARMEREAHWLETVTGRNISRRGDFPQV